MQEKKRHYSLIPTAAAGAGELRGAGRDRRAGRGRAVRRVGRPPADRPRRHRRRGAAPGAGTGPGGRRGLRPGRESISTTTTTGRARSTRPKTSVIYKANYVQVT